MFIEYWFLIRTTKIATGNTLSNNITVNDLLMRANDDYRYKKALRGETGTNLKQKLFKPK
jgi:hypothetical protein